MFFADAGEGTDFHIDASSGATTVFSWNYIDDEATEMAAGLEAFWTGWFGGTISV